MNAYDVEARHGGMGGFAGKGPIYAGHSLLSSTSLGTLLAVVSHTNLYRSVLWSLPSCSKSTTMVMLRDLDFLDDGYLYMFVYNCISIRDYRCGKNISVSCSSDGGG